MVWGCFANSGRGNLVFIENHMDQYKYINILKVNLKIAAQKLPIQNTFNLHQDNGSKHTSLNVRLWLLYNCPKVIKTPPYSPDLNPIEYVWHELEKRTRKHGISSEKQLKAILTVEWIKIEHSYTKKVESLPKKETREVFWDGPCDFKQLSDYEDHTLAGTLSPKFLTTPAGGSLAQRMISYQADLQWNRVSNLGTSIPEAETLPQVHGGD
ncbi:Transposable element Tc1 transposase [Araneus ventricosus]|uniref:Transposable element Tc1 transposase n=1 Tax=Araneus ventricosus TaxID=182803 RepID=A0A4Y2W576_ARAVE|nr:Transposable element Tc1 transposase [Araneus ventricosus]